jgi:hypothetical protein
VTPVSLAWLALVLVHAAPALAAFSPALRKRLYGVEENQGLAIMLAHRGALFLAVAAACAYAAFDGAARPLASIVAGVSVLSYLLIYASHGAPKGALRTVAIVDAIALAPLTMVLADVWL